MTAPITEDLSTTLKYNYTKLDYKSRLVPRDPGLSNHYWDVVDHGAWVRSSISHTLTFDTIDDRTLPRDGIFAQVTQEIAGLGGDSEYYKITGKARYFHTLLDDADVIGSLSVGGGHMWGFGDTRVYDQFTLSASDVRGFESAGIGPRARQTSAPGSRDSIGGTTYFAVSAEASFPLPLVPRDSGFRGAIFADAGTLYGSDVKTTGDDVWGTDMSLRASVGASIIWASPFGPLRFDYAVPIKKEEFDEVQRFKFGIATQF